MCNEYRSNPIVLTEGGADLFLKRHREADHLYACYLGHCECSPWLHGPCFDETVSNFPEADRPAVDSILAAIAAVHGDDEDAEMIAVEMADKAKRRGVR